MMKKTLAPGACSEEAAAAALDALFSAVAAVRHVLHARAVAQSSSVRDALTPDSAPAQEVYVLGMALAEQAQHVLAVHACRGGQLPPAWLAQGVVDGLAGCVRLAESQQHQSWGRVSARLQCAAPAVRRPE